MRGDSRRWFDGAACGALFGLVEVVLAYGTGALHTEDVAVILAFDIVLMAVAGAVLRALGSLRRGSHPFVAFSIIAIPMLLLVLAGLRSPGRGLALMDGARLGLVVGGALVVPLLVYTLTRRRPLLAAPSLIALCILEAWIVSRQLGGRWDRPIASKVEESGVVTGERPSVLLITLDTLRADHLSVYGYSKETAPQLSRLASTATVFDRAYAPSPYTLASHASLFTGLLPSRHGAHPIPFTARPVSDPEKVTRLGDYPLPPEARTLAEDLRERGYRTGAIVANGAYLARWTGLDQGFQHYDANTSALRIGYAPVVVFAARRFWPALFRRMTYAPQWHAHQITAAAEQWLSDVGSQPFFLFLNYLEPHAPYSPDPAILKRFRPPFDCAAVSFERVRAAVMDDKRPVLQRERDCLVSQYDAEIFEMDIQLGRLFQWLAARGKLESTLIVVTADHGEYFGEHLLFGHDNGLHEEVLRIPLIVREPHQRRSRRPSEFVSLMDIRGMILDFADRKGSREAPAERVLAEHWTRERQRVRDPQRFGQAYSRAIYAAPFKLIDERASQRLYDLFRDPFESEDLLDAGAPGALETTRRLLAAAPAPSDASRSQPAANADAAALERLRALGYLE